MNDKIEFIVKNRLKISADDFQILNPNTYKLLEKYNYNTKQLKTMCRFHKLKLSGNKVDIQTRIYNYLKYYKHATIIQKTYRGYLVRKINKLKGPALFKKSICNNEEDFITLEKIKNIDYYDFFSFKHNNNIYGFSLLSIYKYIILKKNKENPYDRTKLSQDINKQLIELRRLSKLLKLNFNFEEKVKKKPITINDIFNRMDELGNYTNVEWYNQLEHVKLLKFYKELYDIWIYRANLSMEEKYKISTIDPFLNIKPNFYFNYTTNELHRILLSVMERLLYNACSIEYQKMGAMYILTALTLVSQPAAEAIPWLYFSVI